jgi:hypothetical protein
MMSISQLLSSEKASIRRRNGFHPEETGDYNKGLLFEDSVITDRRVLP